MLHCTNLPVEKGKICAGPRDRLKKASLELDPARVMRQETERQQYSIDNGAEAGSAPVALRIEANK
jgi:hypothetical protein